MTAQPVSWPRTTTGSMAASQSRSLRAPQRVDIADKRQQARCTGIAGRHRQARFVEPHQHLGIDAQPGYDGLTATLRKQARELRMLRIRPRCPG